jgi:TolB-like protein/predicted Ser/Thr protein kinase/Flp pilus assembly protein TadD
MTNTSRVCRKCGATVFADAPQGCCSVCLVRTGLASLDDENYEASEPTIARMLKDFGDYELLQEIGRGGQGVVYRARQKSLNRIVALKVIDIAHWATEAHLKRFRTEAESAASLDDPRIVPIYEIGERDGACYYSMKFIEGEQLDKITRSELMPARKAAELMAKLAHTLHHAHQHGVLHRDVKPGNILLDPKGEPHLIDFGLARLVETESTITQTLEVLGTPSYIAPEQAAGNNTQLTSATDVYGLGAVLYQLLTGHPPFAGSTTYETVRLVLDTEPRQPRLWNRKIDRDLATICLKCLDKDPQRRYSSALALAEDLERWLKHEPIRGRRTGIFTRGRKWVRRNPSSALLVASLVALAAAIGALTLALPFYWHRNLTTSSLPEKSIAVLPFQNLSRDPDNAYFADGIQEEILTRLASIADLKVISRSSTQQYESKPRNLREIAKQLGVANILEGSVQKAADQLRVNVQLVNAQTDSHLWAETYDRKLTDIFSVESEIAKAIADQLRAKLTGQEEQAISAKPTDNVEAYDAYLRGLAFDARSLHTLYYPDLAAKAAGFYERAVELDPKFALAWARLSRVNAHLYFSGGVETTSAQRDAAKRALEKAQKLESNSPETVLALGYYQYWVLRDYAAAKTTFQLVREILPGNSEAPFALGRVARREGHWDESIAYLEQALALDPRNVEWLLDLAETYSLVRQFSAALKLYDRVLDISPNDPDVMAVKASIYQAQGNLQGAAKLLSEIDGQTPSELAFSRKIKQLRFERNYGEAVRLLQARLAQFHYDSQYTPKAVDQVELAFIQRVAGDWASAKVTAEQARDILERLYRDESHMPRGRAELAANLSRAYAVIGEKEAALKIAAHAIMLHLRAKDPKVGPAFEENLALIQTMFGENGQAISTLAQLLQTSYNSWHYGPPAITPALLRLDPLWDPLRTDPAFQKLCEDKAEKSIAVLPFENLSKDEENAFFAGGVQDEILNNLAKVADLKVISRTSVMKYKSDRERNLRDISKALGVSHVVEGSVQRAGKRVRVSAQLIDARNDAHLWAEHYDRDMADVFTVQTEIAQQIVSQLQAKLSAAEKAAIAERPTADLVAYAYYAQAKEFDWDNWEGAEKSLNRKVELLEKATQRDPSFALAYVPSRKRSATSFQ